MKPSTRRGYIFEADIAPRAGARIETSVNPDFFDLHNIAPRAGARIETGKSLIIAMLIKIAPRAGARIETMIRLQS
ncbi:hypothetical protein L21SP2_0563 [Salinispira pacifica]|uniref:Uncharacterized protein n=1 Tax=Salinispira pacifica TaxID=1307761 RepID=V5WED0_9SPIO|nr:hypothetical protein L21SP2_0563 [Salinispira pacifica]